MKHATLAALAACLVAACAHAVGLFNRFTVSRPSFDHQGLTVLDATRFSASVVHMRARLTAGNFARGNGQENIWASTGWTNDGTAGQVGSIEQGGVTTTGISTNSTLTRFARWDVDGTITRNRLILNGTGDIGGMFDSGDPYRFSVVRIVSGAAVIMTWAPPSSGGNTTFADWRRPDGDMTQAMWEFLDAIESGDSIIIAIHQGAASYG